jgi:hypothetical protein
MAEGDFEFQQGSEISEQSEHNNQDEDRIAGATEEEVEISVIQAKSPTYMNPKLRKLLRDDRQTVRERSLFGNMRFDGPRVAIEKIKAAWGE